MPKILFLSHRAPFPPDKGEKIRAHYILRHLAQRHEVLLGAPAVLRAEMSSLEEAKGLCKTVFYGRLGDFRSKANLLLGFLTARPLSVMRFVEPRLKTWVHETIAQEQPDFIYIFSTAMGAYLPKALPAATQLIVDFVDADAEKWRAYAAKTPFPLNLVYALEFKRLKRFEERLLESTQSGIIVSETEKRLLQGFYPEHGHKFHVIPNGVNTDYFHPSPQSAPNPGLVVFCGAMDYLPNIDGATWFATEVLPLIKTSNPNARFRIVGSNPTPAVRALGGLEGVEVTGSVPDVRPHLHQASVVVAPLRIARGIQNKVLEGMAAGRPMVATPEALDGIDARPGLEVLTGNDAGSFAHAVSSILSGTAPPDLAQKGRAYILENYQWDARLRALDSLIAASGQVFAQER